MARRGGQRHGAEPLLAEVERELDAARRELRELAAGSIRQS